MGFLLFLFLFFYHRILLYNPKGSGGSFKPTEYLHIPFVLVCGRVQKRIKDQFKNHMDFLCHVVLLQSWMGWSALKSTACLGQILSLTFLALEFWFHLSWNLVVWYLSPDWPRLYPWQEHVFFLAVLKDGHAKGHVVSWIPSVTEKSLDSSPVFS